MMVLALFITKYSLLIMIQSVWHFQDLTVLIDEFQLSLFLATDSRPLILILDSLDMLDPSHNARQLQWLPSKLRPNVKIIVSTLPDAQYECLPVLQVKRCDTAC